MHLAPEKPGIIFVAMRRLAFLACAAALLACRAARAETWTYSMSVPDGMPATFQTPFNVPYAGTVLVEAQWTGGRLLFFGVDAPGHASYTHRSGPSPQKLVLDARDPALVGTQGWKVTIKALPARGEAAGTIKITVPDSPAVVAKREAELHPPPPPPPPPPAWTLPATVPAGASPELTALFAAVEAYRAAILSSTDTTSDACQWQLDFLVFVTAARDRLASEGAPPDLPALRYFARLADAIAQVEPLRTSRDPILAGPLPTDPDERRAWLMVRLERVRPIERSLDELHELLRGGHAPSLESEIWLPRLNACLSSCERFFEEKVRLGRDDVPNRELALAQWSRLRAAEGVFRAFAAWRHEPGDLPR